MAGTASPRRSIRHSGNDQGAGRVRKPEDIHQAHPNGLSRQGPPAESKEPILLALSAGNSARVDTARNVETYRDGFAATFRGRQLDYILAVRF
jgi:hypothetical protein